jgi:hypothetical protein
MKTGDGKCLYHSGLLKRNGSCFIISCLEINAWLASEILVEVFSSYRNSVIPRSEILDEVQSNLTLRFIVKIQDVDPRIFDEKYKKQLKQIV